jgi:hypothetical protein
MQRYMNIYVSLYTHHGSPKRNSLPQSSLKQCPSVYCNQNSWWNSVVQLAAEGATGCILSRLARGLLFVPVLHLFTETAAATSHSLHIHVAVIVLSAI